ncbi:MAG: hypothetical protein L0H79_20595 [Intrasporangium sp.]|uniref:DUF7379 domain-containing protein n=1 Tax=Intrasporangium sp. TaxID=1925024 RepID=UPI002649C171|nr:hypothetical protein [Intrasporangium sp.]MDN5798126.1 hypothetical protein [Intrasporangium sp.]
MAQLDASARRIDLGRGVVITAPGLRGTAVLQQGNLGGRGGEPDRTTNVWQDALARAEMRQVIAVEVQATEAPAGAGGVGAGAGTRAGTRAGAGSAAGAVARGARATVRFVMPRVVAAPRVREGEAAAGVADRSLITLIGKKILSVLVYRVVTELVGVAAQFVASVWERSHRPTHLRDFGPAAYGLAPTPQVAGEGFDGSRLTSGRSLIFLHGAFSTGRGSFGALRRTILVATPDSGTPLADGKLLGTYVDRMTTLLDLVPPGPWTVVLDVLDAVLEVVKILGQGALGGLPGLASMRPGSEFLAGIAATAPDPSRLFAIDADFEPEGSLAALWRLPDSLLDKVFGDRPNDAVAHARASGMSADRAVSGWATATPCT